MRTIALIDPYIGGHHLNYVQTFAKTLLELGYRVIVFFPNTNKIKTWINANCTGEAENLLTVEFGESIPTVPLLNRFNFTKALYNWLHAAKVIRKAEKEYQLKIDLVFFAWLDSYVGRFLHPFIINSVFPYKWSGLYFHPWFMRLNPEVSKLTPTLNNIDKILTSSNCINISVLDQGIVNSFSQRLNGKKVVLFPDFADVTPPDPFYPIALSIKEQAKGRIIIGMISLEKRKGIITLMELAKKASSKDFFFVFAGKLKIEEFNAIEQDYIRGFINQKQENFYFHFQVIPTDAEFNAVFSTFDISFIVYQDFPSSSNALTKSAIFKKHVLATERFCIGENVRKYDLGVTVQEGNVEKCLEGIKILKDKINSKYYPYELANEYTRLNGEQILSARFSELLSDLN
jgi:hypothetical protein